MDGWEKLLKDGQERLEAKRLEEEARENERVRRLDDERRREWEQFELAVVDSLPADIVPFIQFDRGEPFIQFDRGEAWQKPGAYDQGVAIRCSPGLDQVWATFTKHDGRWVARDYNVAGWRLDAPCTDDELPGKWRVVVDRNNRYTGNDLGLALAVAAERAVEKKRLEADAASRNAADELECQAIQAQWAEQRADGTPVSPEQVESNRLLEALGGDQVALALVDVFRAIQAERGAWWSQQE